VDIAITGSIAYDYLMRFPGKFHEHIIADKLDHLSVSFLVEDMKRHWGGVAANIAYTLALLRQTPPPKLVGTAGKDFGEYRAWLENAGVDTSPVCQIDDVFTASCFINTDAVNSQIVTFASGAMAYARNFALAELLPNRPDFVVISPNDPGAMRRYVDECRASGIPFMYDPSQQVAWMDGTSIRYGIERCNILICNDYEFEIILQKTGWTLEGVLDCVPTVIITRGEQGSSIYTEGTCITVPVFPAERIADPTGVGDAFRAGVLRGLSAGWPWKLCGEVGALCATYVLENVGTQNHTFTPAQFAARFRTVFDDQGALDALSG